MLIERFLRYCATRTTEHYLAFKPGLSCAPPLPDKSKKYLLYIHIPFCEQLCPYCSFIRVQFERGLAGRYFEVLKKEIKNYFSLGYQFDSIYVGGGTPTIWPEKLVEVLSLAKSLWPIRQISTEANPDQLTGQYRSESVWCFSKQAESIDEYIVNHDEYIGVGPGVFTDLNNVTQVRTSSDAWPRSRGCLIR
jgi:hypothetical protein